MQTRTPGPEDVAWSDVRALLERRRGLLDAVVFSGGEPCVDAALPSAIDEVRALGMLVGLHTGGAYPEQLKAVIGRVDWVGLDVKAVPGDDAHWLKVVQTPKAMAHFQACFDVIAHSGTDYEARTTAHPDYMDAGQILAIARWLSDRGCRKYALQIFRRPPGLAVDLPNVVADWPGQAVVDELRAMFETFTLRRG